MSNPSPSAYKAGAFTGLELRPDSKTGKGRFALYGVQFSTGKCFHRRIFEEQNPSKSGSGPSWKGKELAVSIALAASRGPAPSRTRRQAAAQPVRISPAWQWIKTLRPRRGMSISDTSECRKAFSFSAPHEDEVGQ